MRKKLLIPLFLAIDCSLKAATYFVATDGNDNNNGTIDRPFGTWQKGFEAAVEGDTVFIRGGTYYPEGIFEKNTYSGVFINGKNGSTDNPICIWAYQNEIPIMNCRKINQFSNRVGIYLYNSDHWYLKGLSITRVDQHPSGMFTANGIKIYSGNYNKLELIASYSNGGSGITILYASEGNYILNCDAYYNYDRYTSGGNADGIEIADIFERNGNERVNTVRGCRAWDNSDDGFDHYKCEGIVILDSCWVWHNGVIPGTDKNIGDGNGFKLGLTSGTPEKIAQRIVTNCIAADHRQNGFSQQGAQVLMVFYNNTSYKNKGWGYEFSAFNMADTLINNLSYDDGGSGQTRSKQITKHNSWQKGLHVTKKDFTSLESKQLFQPRKINGSLPEIDFLHIAQGSDLIDSGTEVGIKFNGKAPDIGAFESHFHKTNKEFNLFLYYFIQFLLP